MATSARKAQYPFWGWGQLKEYIPVNMCMELRGPPRLMFPHWPIPLEFTVSARPDEVSSRDLSLPLQS